MVESTNNNEDYLASCIFISKDCLLNWRADLFSYVASGIFSNKCEELNHKNANFKKLREIITFRKNTKIAYQRKLASIKIIHPYVSHSISRHKWFWDFTKYRLGKTDKCNCKQKNLLLIDSLIDYQHDLGTVEKYISDYAEVLYEVWKVEKVGQFESLLHRFKNNTTQILKKTPKMSDSNLQNLVNTFINEDKARRLTNGKNTNFFDSKNGSSACKNITESEINKRNTLDRSSVSITDTLRKFESINSCQIKNNFSLSKSSHFYNRKDSSFPNERKKSCFSTDSMSFDGTSKEINSTINLPVSECNLPESHCSFEMDNVLKTISVKNLIKPQKPFKPASLTKNYQESFKSPDRVVCLSTPIYKNEAKFPVLSVLPKHNISSRNDKISDTVTEMDKNNQRKICQNQFKMHSSVLESSIISNQNDTPLENYKQKTIVGNKDKNFFFYPTTPLTLHTDCIQKEENLNGSQVAVSKANKKENVVINKQVNEDERNPSKLSCKFLNTNWEDLIIKKNNDFDNTFLHLNQLNTVIDNDKIVRHIIPQNVDINSFEANDNELYLKCRSIDIKKQLGYTKDIKSEFTREKKIERSQETINLVSELISMENLKSPKNASNNPTSLKTLSILTSKSSSSRFNMRSKSDIALQNNANSIESIKSPKLVSPVQPFLTRGSVAERIMMFEKCPDISKTSFRNVVKEPQYKPKLHAVNTIVPKSEFQRNTTLQRAVKGSNIKNLYIPRFHYPYGKPLPNIAQETTIQQLKAAFDVFPNNQCSKEDFHKILKLCHLPFYWRMPFISCTQIMSGSLIDGYRFVDFWKQMSVYCHDLESKFVYILSRGQKSRLFILPEDLTSLVQDVVDNHPGLAFLKEASEFHSRYIHTVISRIFYTVNRSWSNRITISELRRSNLLQVIQLLENEEDINQIMEFFSYEHFYVIYCKFWELDRDHDLFIDQNDLAQHNNHALSTRIIERIFSGCVTRGEKFQIPNVNEPKMSYAEFVWFLLSEEDKTNPTSIEYWFRCMDIDGDGVISMYELEYFYEEQQERMLSLGIETLPFEDCLCQMLDMIQPKKTGLITLGDLKRCKMTSVFYDTFFNLVKYLENEQRDPFTIQKENDGMSDWDRYAAQEYELLVAEENDANGAPEQSILTYKDYLQKKKPKK